VDGSVWYIFREHKLKVASSFQTNIRDGELTEELGLWKVLHLFCSVCDLPLPREKLRMLLQTSAVRLQRVLGAAVRHHLLVCAVDGQIVPQSRQTPVLS